MIRKFDIQHEYNRLKEKFLTAIVWRLPKSIILWSTIRAGAHATTGKYGDTITPEITFVEVLKRWGN